jgi:hypothetical protein
MRFKANGHLYYSGTHGPWVNIFSLLSNVEDFYIILEDWLIAMSLSINPLVFDTLLDCVQTVIDKTITSSLVKTLGFACAECHENCHHIAFPCL